MRTIKEVQKHLSETGYSMEAMIDIWYLFAIKNIVIDLDSAKCGENSFSHFMDWFENDASINTKETEEPKYLFNEKDRDSFIKEQKETLKAYQQGISACKLLTHPKNKYLQEMIYHCILSYEHEMDNLDELINATED